MSKEVSNLMDEFMGKLFQVVDDDVSSINIFMNCEGYKVEYNYTPAEVLKARGISMRNIKGDFIK